MHQRRQAGPGAPRLDTARHAHEASAHVSTGSGPGRSFTLSNARSTNCCHLVSQDLRAWRSWGAVKKYHHELKGGNSRLDAIQVVDGACKPGPPSPLCATRGRAEAHQISSP